MAQNLHVNILTFQEDKERFSFWFTDKDDTNLVRFHASAVPVEVVQHFGELDFYYTSFTEEHAGFLKVTKKTTPDKEYSVTEDGEEIAKNIPNTAFSISILKKFYNKIIGNYFKSIGCLVMPNFINAVEIWIPTNISGSQQQYNFYKKITLRVQKAVVSNDWEIVVIYEGQSKIFKKAISDLEDTIPNSAFNWVIYNNNFYRFKDLPKEVRLNLDQTYPIWNFNIRKALGEPTAAPDRSNRYVGFKKEIQEFYSNFLNQEGFLKLINLSANGFYKVPERKIGEVSVGSNRMIFGKNNTDISPMKGMRNYGPYDVSDASVVEFFYIFHSKDEAAVIKLHEYFKGKHDTFKGLSKFILTPYHPDKNLKINFTNIEDPWPEINAGLHNLQTKKEVSYVAIYVSPFSKDEATPQQKKVYYLLKEKLLHLGILSQVIDAKKTINNRMFEYSALNMAIAILAKLDGIPWQLDTTLKKELIVGVGAFKNPETGVKYIASAFSFHNNGKFNCFDHFFENQTTELAGSIIHKVREYTSIDPNLKRLVIHFYKTLSRKELEPIEKGLRNLGLAIPVIIISINKTSSTDITAFDDNYSELIPISGTYINVGYRKYILFNNTRYKVGTMKSSDGYPFPIKFQIFCSDEKQIADTKIVKELIDQVYQFSRMYWKSVRQQNLPVTLKYSEMVAEMLPHFQDSEIPNFGKDKLWFL